MKIGEVSKIVGLNSSAIRFYESHGLLKSSSDSRAANGYRVYCLEDVDKILLIVKFKEFGLELNEIKKLLCEEKKTCNDLLYSLDEQLVKYRKMENEIKARIKLLLMTKESCETQCASEKNIEKCCG